MPTRRVFHSFHYANDSWRAAQVRNIGTIEGNEPVKSNTWEEVKRKGDESVRRWIDDNMQGRSCIVVLIGAETASRKWCKYEIEHAWKEGKGVVGVYIHKLLDQNQKQSVQGKNPFDLFYIDKTFNYIKEQAMAVDGNEVVLSKVCKTYNPPCNNSSDVYAYIGEHINDWVEEAICIRNSYPK